MIYKINNRSTKMHKPVCLFKNEIETEDDGTFYECLNSNINSDSAIDRIFPNCTDCPYYVSKCQARRMIEKMQKTPSYEIKKNVAFRIHENHKNLSF